MKIKRVKRKKEETNHKDSLFLNIYYFLMLYKYIALLIIGLGLSVFIILLVLDSILPNELNSIDRKMTLKLFDELQEANRHQDAILLMEFKGNVLEDSPFEIEYKTKLTDSYIHIGDYSKSEKLFIDIQNNKEKYYKDLSNKAPQLDAFLQFSMARNFYQFYEKVGDKKNQKKHFYKYKSLYDKCDGKIIDSLAQFEGNTMFNIVNAHTLKELITYDSIIVASFEDEEMAIELMSKFVNQLLAEKEFGASYKVKCLNKLIGWQLNNGRLTDAYVNIYKAIALVRDMKSIDEYVNLGELSDYCYQIHDIETSKSLFKRYQRFLDKKYNKGDFEYISNYARSFRYLEAENNWEQLIDELEEYCIGMRRQIALNIPSMTEQQQTFFAEMFDVAYDYAFHILQVHPDNRMADLCFDNVSFKNGLLLRSNRSVENSISALNDSTIMEMYQELKDCRLNLIYQEVSNKTFFNKREKTEARIEQLEKEIALKCTDFKTKNDIIQNDHNLIQSKLAKSEAITELVEYNGELFALILDEKSHVTYIPIVNLSQIKDKLHNRHISEIYHDETLTNDIWNKISQAIIGKKTVFYVPVGWFNQLAIGTLYVGNNQYLSDVLDIRLISNPSDIIERPKLNLTANTTKISLWGGIDYEMNNNVLPHKFKRAAIFRGDTLMNLLYAYKEVKDVSSLLDEHNIRNTVFSEDIATESAFKERTSEKDHIIHISTHGFFNEKSNLYNSMLESGLFFAGANKYWCGDLTPEFGEDDGILRAAEIAQLNLSSCSLVVLSACETGLGYNNSSEGVYGLQRAFKLAGADMVLMSLWDVDDRATSILMTEFYKNLIAGKDVDDALASSKDYVRQQYPSPEDWGGFVLLH